MNDEWYGTPQYPIGKRIAELRGKKNMNLRQLARNAGISAGFISEIEHQKKNPTVRSLKKICRGLGISFLQFFAEEDSAPLPEDPLIHLVCHLDPRQRQMINQFLDLLLQDDEFSHENL